MDTRPQSALAKTAAKARPAKKATVPEPVDVSELFLAELAARRTRLQELLQLVRKEVAREPGSRNRAARPRACRRMPSTRVRNQLAMGSANTD